MRPQPNSAPVAQNVEKDRILVIKLSALGDVLLAMASMAAIRAHHAHAHITLLTTPAFADIATRSCYFDAVEARPRAPFYDLPAWLGMRRFLNAGGFSRVYDLQMNDRTRVYYRLFARKPLWSGVIAGNALFCDARGLKEMHAAERHKKVLAVAGIEVGAPDLSWMTADVSLLGVKSPYALLVPGCSARWPQKRWPALRYGALARKLMQDGLCVAVLGAQDDREAVARVMKACPAAIDLCGRTSLYDIATLARGAQLCIGNDTGPTHLIAMAGCKTLALFCGETHPKLSAPVGGDVTVLQARDIEDISLDDVMKALHANA